MLAAAASCSKNYTHAHAHKLLQLWTPKHTQIERHTYDYKPTSTTQHTHTHTHTHTHSKLMQILHWSIGITLEIRENHSKWQNNSSINGRVAAAVDSTAIKSYCIFIIRIHITTTTLVELLITKCANDNTDKNNESMLWCGWKYNVKCKLEKKNANPKSS